MRAPLDAAPACRAPRQHPALPGAQGSAKNAKPKKCGKLVAFANTASPHACTRRAAVLASADTTRSSSRVREASSRVKKCGAASEDEGQERGSGRDTGRFRSSPAGLDPFLPLSLVLALPLSATDHCAFSPASDGTARPAQLTVPLDATAFFIPGKKCASMDVKSFVVSMAPEARATRLCARARRAPLPCEVLCVQTTFKHGILSLQE